MADITSLSATTRVLQILLIPSSRLLVADVKDEEEDESGAAVTIIEGDNSCVTEVTGELLKGLWVVPVGTIREAPQPG